MYLAVRHSASVAGDIENFPTKPPAHADCLPIVWRMENEEVFEFQVRPMENHAPRSPFSRPSVASASDGPCVVRARGRRPAPIHACDEPDRRDPSDPTRGPMSVPPPFFLDTSARF